jgi:hypothetical protein
LRASGTAYSGKFPDNVCKIFKGESDFSDKHEVIDDWREEELDMRERKDVALRPRSAPCKSDER